MMEPVQDVIVIGAGPAGATTSGLLAKAGHRVLMLDHERFPRPHVGESLLPAELPVFEQLGFDAGTCSVFKSGADFLDERTGELGRFPFSEALEGTPTSALHVERAEFDHRLALHAESLGAVWKQRSAKRVDAEADHVTVVLDDGSELRARFVVDATGRDRLLCKQQRAFERIEGFGVAVVFGHFSGLSDDAQAELHDVGAGNITVLLIDRGWGWIIPLPNRRMSVGFVSTEKGVVSEAWHEHNVAASEKLRRLTRGATRSELRREGDYSFRNTQSHGSRWACVGDSKAFLDPVFSSGIAFAMAGGSDVVALLDPALREGREADPDLLAPCDAKMDHAYDVFGALIHSFYHSNLVRNLFFYDDPDPELRAGFISVLAGDVWRDDNRFQEMLLRSKRRMERRQSLK